MSVVGKVDVRRDPRDRIFFLELRLVSPPLAESSHRRHLANASRLEEQLQERLEHLRELISMRSEVQRREKTHETENDKSDEGKKILESMIPPLERAKSAVHSRRSLAAAVDEEPAPKRARLGVDEPVDLTDE